jgi:hypothetical protein
LLASASQKAISRQMVRKFATTACEHVRIKGGGYRRTASVRWLNVSK